MKKWKYLFDRVQIKLPLEKILNVIAKIFKAHTIQYIDCSILVIRKYFRPLLKILYYFTPNDCIISWRVLYRITLTGKPYLVLLQLVNMWHLFVVILIDGFIDIFMVYFSTWLFSPCKHLFKIISVESMLWNCKELILYIPVYYHLIRMQC